MRSLAVLLGGFALAVVAVKTPDNTCGGRKGYTCDPKLAAGGACCSSHGYCGNTAAYCGQGCQKGFGACDLAGVGRFNHFANYTFQGSKLPSGLIASNYVLSDTLENPRATHNHSFIPGNVAVSNGWLTLTVPGGQTKNPITCGEVVTSVTNIFYASVRVKALLTSEPGVVDGMFFYKNDCQETDIEYLSDPNSESNPGKGAKPTLQYTNQDLGCNPDHATYTPVKAPTNVVTQVHEYRVDWLAGKSKFYTDGVLQKVFTTNVPTQPGSWIFNIWTNGDPGFTVGPPKEDAVLKISNIVMYYNTTS